MSDRPLGKGDVVVFNDERYVCVDHDHGGLWWQRCKAGGVAPDRRQSLHRLGVTADDRIKTSDKASNLPGG